MSLFSIARAQEAEKKTPVPAPVNFKIQAAYHKAMQYQSEYQTQLQAACNVVPQCKAAQDKLNASVAEYQASLPGWLKEAGLPADAVIQIDDKTDAVTSTVPKKAKKEPELKK